MGAISLLFALYGLASGQTTAFVGRARAIQGQGFWVSREEKPNLYWWNQGIYFGAAVICIGCGVFMLREKDPPKDLPKR